MSFDGLFGRAAEYDVDTEAVSAAVAKRRSDSGDETTDTEGDADISPLDRDPSPARVVADADALAADLLVGGAAREALDVLRAHSWTTLVASDALLDDAEAVIAALADPALAADWRDAVEAWREPVAHPAGDHPALASAYRGAAMQIVSIDPALTGARAAAGLRDRLPVSVREPRAFATVFSAEKLYPETIGGDYPGPDRDPRSMAPVRTDGGTDGLAEGDAPELPADLDAVREALIAWYETDHRDFPWRRTEDPYEVLVSEVMSQQTQLDRVVPAWEDFLDEWPTTVDLAAADRGDVVAFWSDHSLGYNNRAKYLHEAAGQVEDDYAGAFPESPDELQELMGVGPYTANAVASFAFNDGDAVVDTNVKRVLHRAFAVPDDDEAFGRVASHAMPAGESRVWNNAIMELGGVACQKTPRCDEAGCPWREWCHAYETGDFTAPDVPTQPEFEGSRRQFRGRIVRVLGEHDEVAIDDLGHRIRVDYTPGGEHGRTWLRGLLSDLSDDGLVQIEDGDDRTTARLR